MDQRTVQDRRRARQTDEARLRAIIDGMADGVVVVDLDGVIRFANPAADRLLARPSAPLIGTYFGFPSVAGDSTEIDVIRADGQAVGVELRVVDADWEGRPAHIVSLRDISDRRRAEERSEQLQRERTAHAKAEAASQAKSEFLAMMSHELRTPLNAIIGYTELLDLRIGGSLADEHRQQLSRIRESADHLLGLVNEILDLAKDEAGRLTLSSAAAAAANVVDAALALVQPAADKRAITLSTMEEVPERGTTYYGDDDRVRQILVNLLTNAVKFTPAGGRASVVYGRAARTDDPALLSGPGPWVYFRVSDTGVGIPADQLARIFEPFAQAESGPTRSSDGSGLGLTISRRLARLMKGDITVASVPTQGSTFTLWLPAAQAEHGLARSRAEPLPADGRFIDLTGIAAALHDRLNALLEAFVDRVREERIAPNVESLSFPQLSDHFGAYVSTLASILSALQDSHGQPSSLASDGSDILRMLAERHGAQRQRLGMPSSILKREWELLGDEMHGVIRRCARTVPEPALAEATIIVDRCIEQAVEASLRAYTRAAAEQRL
ncbi:MAG: sensor histidine kinase [Gemmatimonadaceae bacterium]